MGKSIGKILKEHVKLLEFGMRSSTVKKNMPKQYLFKGKEEKTDDLKKYLRTLSSKVNKLYVDIVSDLKSIEWYDIKLYPHNEFFYIVLPKKIKNKIDKLSNYYLELESYDYLNLLQPKEKIVQLNNDYIDFIQDDYIYSYIDEPRNRTHFPKGLPKSLLGFNLGIKIYQKMLDYLGFIQSEPNATKEVQNIFRKLTQYKDLNVVLYRNRILLIKDSLSPEIKLDILHESLYETYKELNWHRRLKLGEDILIDTKLKRQLGTNRIVNLLNTVFDDSKYFEYEPFSNIK